MVGSPITREWVLPDEPVPIRLMSTIWADTGGLHDDLERPSDLDSWLDAVGLDGGRSGATRREFEAAVRLRNAARRVAAHLTRDDRAAAQSATTGLDEAIDALNDTMAQRAGTRLVNRNGELRLEKAGSASPVTTALAAVAAESSELFAGDDAEKLRACHAPGCVLYFVQSHPRREWCSITCGNRARAARYYERVRVWRASRDAQVE